MSRRSPAKSAPLPQPAPVPPLRAGTSGLRADRARDCRLPWTSAASGPGRSPGPLHGRHAQGIPRAGVSLRPAKSGSQPSGAGRGSCAAHRVGAASNPRARPPGRACGSGRAHRGADAPGARHCPSNGEPGSAPGGGAKRRPRRADTASGTLPTTAAARRNSRLAPCTAPRPSQRCHNSAIHGLDYAMKVSCCNDAVMLDCNAANGLDGRPGGARGTTPTGCHGHRRVPRSPMGATSTDGCHGHRWVPRAPGGPGHQRVPRARAATTLAQNRDDPP